MVGKVISGSSFSGTVGYVMKEESRILEAEGIMPPEVKDMVQDFKDQTLLNPRLKNNVGHISLVFLTQRRPADDRRPDDADRKGVHAEDGHHRYAVSIGAPSRPAPSALPSGLQPGREQRADHFGQEHQDPQRQGLPGADREVRIVSRTGKGRRTAGAAARTRQDQIRNLRCDQRLSAQVQEVGTNWKAN